MRPQLDLARLVLFIDRYIGFLFSLFSAVYIWVGRNVSLDLVADIFADLISDRSSDGWTSRGADMKIG